MKKIKLFLIFIVMICCSILTSAQNKEIPLPSASQLRWQNYEQIMFLCLDPATWQGREYDNHSLPLSRINPKQLDTDQWCKVAKSWDAKLILFVAKHCGGFCWWQTNTSEYGIKNTPWKNGKGDVLKELSESCRKYGLDLGVYVYPGDEQWGAGIGSGGITSDPSKQLEYNKIYRQQLTEVLSQYGQIREVWFDGNCHIPIADLIKEHASDAVILQSKSASLRWVGNEDGYAPDPNWYTLKHEDLETGGATAVHSDVNGDAYAPVEADVPFLKNNGHKWFWAPDTDNLLMRQAQLMNLYYKSVGRGSVLLLNATPDTTGLIPHAHEFIYEQFGKEIAVFSKPIKSTSASGEQIEISFDTPTIVNHSILKEELSKGQRVISYKIEGSADGIQWKQLYVGTSIGNKKIDHFPDVCLQKIRVVFVKAKATPHIRNFSIYNVQSLLSDTHK